MKMDENRLKKGNNDLLMMFKSKTFDRSQALCVLENISDINQPILDLYGNSSTYLFEAQSYNNVEAVRFLLENGADPNLCDIQLMSWCALEDLHFLCEEITDEAEQRLEIAKLFFEFGGDPNLVLDGETLYDHVLWEVFNYEYVPHDREYLFAFFKLLIAYGGGGGRSSYEKPVLMESIDKNRIQEYIF